MLSCSPDKKPVLRRNFTVYSHTSSIDADDLKDYLKYLSDLSEPTILDKLGDFNISEEHIKVFTGMTMFISSTSS